MHVKMYESFKHNNSFCLIHFDIKVIKIETLPNNNISLGKVEIQYLI